MIFVKHCRYATICIFSSALQAAVCFMQASKFRLGLLACLHCLFGFWALTRNAKGKSNILQLDSLAVLDAAGPCWNTGCALCLSYQPDKRQSKRRHALTQAVRGDACSRDMCWYVLQHQDSCMNLDFCEQVYVAKARNMTAGIRKGRCKCKGKAAYLACTQSWMLVVHTPVAKSNSSKVKKCIGTKNSSQQYGIACKHHGSGLSTGTKYSSQ